MSTYPEAKYDVGDAIFHRASKEYGLVSAVIAHPASVARVGGLVITLITGERLEVCLGEICQAKYRTAHQISEAMGG